MPFTGKATYGAGATLPELAEDVSDIIGIVSPHEAALLDHLGDAKRAAAGTVHEWVEDTLLPNFDLINQSSFTPSPTTATSIVVDNGARFQAGDLVRPEATNEVMLVTVVATNTLTVVRAYGGTTAATLVDNMKLNILGNAALEGDSAPKARFTSRVRKVNYTQIFTASVDVSGSMQAARQHGVSDEADYQRQERIRELVRDLENCVINGVAPASSPEGSSTVRRSMSGIISSVTTNRFVPNQGGMPPGAGGGSNGLNEEVLNAAMRFIWEQSQGGIDTIVCGGLQKRKLNAFLAAARSYESKDTKLRDLMSVYESDFGVCKVVLSRWVPADTVLLLDSSRISVLPLQGRSFHYKPLGPTGDSVTGQVIGEYTLEFKNENAHGLIRGLATS